MASCARPFSVRPIPDDSQGRWYLKVGNDPEVRFDPASVHSQRDVCKDKGVSRVELVEAVKIAINGATPAGAFEMTVDGVPVEVSNDPLAQLDAACEMGGEFIRWKDRTRLAALDIDTTEAWDRPTLRRLAEKAGANRYWLSRNNGGRLVFVNDDMCSAEERAIVATLLLDIGIMPHVEKVELLRHTRAPTGTAYKDASNWAGNTMSWTIAQAEYTEPDPADEREAAEWLAVEGMEIGSRYPHEMCPLDPRPAGGDDPVVPLEGGMYCHRCAGVTGKGFRSWGEMIHERKTEAHWLVEAARQRVPWAHQSATMASKYKRHPFPLSFHRKGYVAILKAVGAGDDERASVMNPNWLWLRAEGGMWVHPVTLEPASIQKTAGTCSYVMGDPNRLQHVLNTQPIDGFMVVRPAQVITRPGCIPDDVVPVLARDDIRPDRDDVMPWDEAFAFAEDSLKGLCEQYLKALLVACVCAESGGEVVGLLACGPSGSGKTGMAAFASNLLGSMNRTQRLDAETEAWRRQIGQALTAGKRIVLVNEVDKIPGFRRHMPKLLDLQCPHTWRPLYNGDVDTPWRAPLVLTGINIPDAFGAPELGRRFRMVRLPQKAADWQTEQIHQWRERSDDHARAGDSLLAWAITFAQNHEFSWRECADVLDLVPANEADPEQYDLMASFRTSLYEHCCGLDGERTMSKAARYPGDHGWVDLTTPRAQEIMATMTEDVAPNVDPRFIVGKDLEAADWVTVLSRKSPLIFESKTHRTTWVGRFRAPGSRTYNENA